MSLKSFAGLFSALGLLAAVVGFAGSPPKSCCDLKLACCDVPSACCAAEAKLGCCAKGLKCCAEKKGCCAAVQKCCSEGLACCEQAKACCGPKQTAASDPTSTSPKSGCCSEKPAALSADGKPACCKNDKQSKS